MIELRLKKKLAHLFLLLFIENGKPFALNHGQLRRGGGQGEGKKRKRLILHSYYFNTVIFICISAKFKTKFFYSALSDYILLRALATDIHIYHL